MGTAGHVLVLPRRIPRVPRGLLAGAIACWFGVLVWLVRSHGFERVVAIAGAAFVALMTFAVIAVRFRLLPNINALILTPEGLVVRVLVFNQLERWSNVRSFFAYASRTSIVGYWRIDKRRRWYDDDIDDGYHEIDADNYDISGSELAALLEEWRVHHGPRPRPF
jgi:hypothetical protein